MSGTSWPHRVFRDLVFLLAGLLGLLMLAVALLWWWSGTEGSLQWTLNQVGRHLPFTVQGVQGSLREGAHIDQLHWREPGGLDVTASDVRLEWQPLALPRSRQLRLDKVQVGRLRIEDQRPSAPPQPPQRLELPLQVQADELKIGQLEWVKDDSAVTIDNLAAGYSFDGTRHHLKLDNLRWAGGQYQGEASLGAQGDLPLDARLRGRFETSVPGGAKALPLKFTAQLQGPLADLQAHAALNAPTMLAPAARGHATASAGAAIPASATATATATARITPWATQPVAQAQAQFQQLDLHALWPDRLPHTLLTGQASMEPSATATWAISAEVSNALAGPWDHSRLPVRQLSAQGEWRAGGQALVRSLQARFGGGRLDAHGQWRSASGWAVQGRLIDVDPSSLYSAMAALPVSGHADAKGEGSAIAFDFDLNAAPRAAPRAKRPANPVTAAVQALELRRARARGRWDRGQLSLPELDLRTADAFARGSLDIGLAERAGSGRIELDAPGLQGRAEGQLAETRGRGNAFVQIADAARALNWVRRLPGVPAPVRDLDLAGRGEARIAWQGGWRDPELQARASLPQLRLRSPAGMSNQAGGTDPWALHNVVATVDGRLSDAAFQLQGRAEQAQRRLGVNLSGRGGWRARSPDVWQGRIADLSLAASDPALGNGAWRLTSQRPFDWRVASGSFDAGAGAALLVPPQAVGSASAAPATLAWDPVRWRTGELKTSGRFEGVPFAWLAIVGGPQLAGSAISGDMVFDARWDANLGATPRVQATIERQRGDLTLSAETIQGASAQVRAGVRAASLSLTSEGEALNLALQWDSERAGHAQGRIATRLARGGAAGWSWPENAPLQGSVRARLPRMGVWSLLAPPGWRLRGSLSADVEVGGTRAQPHLSGTLAADDLALRSVADGIELQGGELRARLDGQRLLIDRFVLHGAGDPATGGSVLASGEGEWTGGAPRARVSAQLNRLRASIRSDRQLTLSGNLMAAVDRQSSEVSGKLHVDQALIVLPEQSAARLGDDVVVHGLDEPVTGKQAPALQEAQAKGARRVRLDIEVDLGSAFRVEGHGIDTHLRGTLVLTGESFTTPKVNGTIRAAGGKYQAYGQDLDIERGVVRFTGAIDNPSLDVLAIRPRLMQPVGVQVTGTVLTPFVRLYSEPEMPDMDKLSWLVLGRASPSGGMEAALLQEAAVALVAGRGGGGKRGIAASLGLDQLSFRRDGPTGPAVTLGKQLGRHIYAAYERSLSGALGTLQLFYDLTRQLKVRAEAGERSALDLIYTLTFN